VEKRLTRRWLLAGASTVALAGCAQPLVGPPGPSPVPPSNTLGQYLAAIISGLSGELGALGQVVGITPAAVAQISDITTKLLSGQQVSAAEVVGAVNTIVGILAPLGEAALGPYGLALAAAVALLPLVERLAGLPVAASLPLRAAALMDEQQALNILRRAASGSLSVTPVPAPGASARFPSRRQCVSSRTGAMFTPRHANARCKIPVQ
jgi:hypothetical protein